MVVYPNTMGGGYSIASYMDSTKWLAPPLERVVDGIPELYTPEVADLLLNDLSVFEEIHINITFKQETSDAKLTVCSMYTRNNRFVDMYDTRAVGVNWNTGEWVNLNITLQPPETATVNGKKGPNGKELNWEPNKSWIRITEGISIREITIATKPTQQ